MILQDKILKLKNKFNTVDKENAKLKLEMNSYTKATKASNVRFCLLRNIRKKLSSFILKG